MKINPDDELQLAEIHLIILNQGLGEVAGEVIPYPSTEYVRRNLLRRPAHPEQVTASNAYDRKPGFRGDNTWELLHHWKIEGLKVEGFQPMRMNPLETAITTKGSLLEFFQSTHYPVPAGLKLPLGINKPTLELGGLEDRTSEELELLFVAWRRFWKNAIYDDPSTWPTPGTVKDWLVGTGFSVRLAAAGATLVSPKWARRGGRPGKRD